MPRPEEVPEDSTLGRTPWRPSPRLTPGFGEPDLQFWPLQDSNLGYLIQSPRSGAWLADNLHGSGDPTEHWRPGRITKMPRSVRRNA